MRGARGWAVALASEQKQNTCTGKDRGYAGCVLVHWERLENEGKVMQIK